MDDLPNEINVEKFSKDNFNTKEIYYYNRINKFYCSCVPTNISKMVDIINGVSSISLRILDWFVTRYSNKNKILININKDILDVHISYKAQLKSYKKKYFDPFKRTIKKRGNFDYHFKNTDLTIQTTLGQLNFFMWAIENKIIDYVEKNYNIISKEMNVSNKDDKKRKKEKQLGKTMTKIIQHTGKVNNKDNIEINVDKKNEPETKQVKIILTFN